MSCAGTLMSPRIDAKIRLRMRYSKFRRPEFKDILRQRFKHRIRESRSVLLDKIRSSKCGDVVQDTLSDYLMNELDGFEKVEYERKKSHEENYLRNETESEIDLESELKVLDNIQSELMEEQLSWIMEEYRKEEEEINAMMMETFLCPVCQRGSLQKTHRQDPISCTICNLYLSPLMSLEQLNASLRLTLSEHSWNCGSDPKFASMDERHAKSLLILCDLCSYFRVVC